MKPQSSIPTPKDAPGFQLKEKTPPSPVRPETPSKNSNLPRDKVQEPNPIDPNGPSPAAAKASLTAENVLSWETGAGKSYLIPAHEVPGFLGLLSVYDWLVYPNQTQDGKKVYSSTFSSTWEHLRKQNWVFDQDPFNINQFAHPYQGATMYGLAGHRRLKRTGIRSGQAVCHARDGDESGTYNRSRFCRIALGTLLVGIG